MAAPSARPESAPAGSSVTPGWYSHGPNRVALGPFVLARAAGAAVVPAFCVMVPVAALERVIRAYPTQWFNFFDAWSPPHGLA